MFETKSFGEKKVFESWMVREIDNTKPRFDLIIPKWIPYEHQLITRFAQLMARGVEKYSARNWENASTEEEMERFKESAFRHFMQWFMWEDDEDHAVAVFFNIQWAEYIKHKKYGTIWNNL